MESMHLTYIYCPYEQGEPYMIGFFLNDKKIQSDCSSGILVLDFIREQTGLTGTKEGCREGDCGACMVLLGRPVKNGIIYNAVNSCLLTLGQIQGCHVVTIEGLNRSDGLTPIQKAFFDRVASQCGFCTPGMIISITGFFLSTAELSLEAGIEALSGNICRCTGYQSIKRAIQDLCKVFSEDELRNTSFPEERVALLVKLQFLPDYFLEVPRNLKDFEPYCLDTQQSSLDKGVLVAGGTDLYIQKAEELRYKKLVFLSNRPEMNFIRVKDKHCHIGATVTIDQIRRSDVIRGLIPSLFETLGLVSSTPIRNRATIGGNIINASPIGDMTIIFLALGASVVLSSGTKQRRVPLEEFFLGYKKLDIKDTEILDSLFFPIPNPGARFNFEKVAKRRYLDIASVNSAILFREEEGIIREIRISAGGVAPVPILLRRTCKYLSEKKLYSQVIDKAAEIAVSDISPISDVRGSAQYKTILLKRFIYAHLMGKKGLL